MVTTEDIGADTTDDCAGGIAFNFRACPTQWPPHPTVAHCQVYPAQMLSRRRRRPAAIGQPGSHLTNFTAHGAVVRPSPLMDRLVPRPPHADHPVGTTPGSRSRCRCYARAGGCALLAGAPGRLAQPKFIVILRCIYVTVE